MIGASCTHVSHAFGLEGRRDVAFEAALLDVEQVGEVGVEEQFQRAVGRLVAVIADDDVLAHPPPDVPMTEEEQRAVRPPGAGAGAQGKRRREGVEGLSLEGLGRLPVHPQLEA
jgi:hypothetical protein